MATPPTTAAAADITVAFKHVLLCVADHEPFLTDGTKLAVATAAQLAGRDQGKVTALIIEEAGTSGGDPKQAEAVGWHLRERGLEKYDVIKRATQQPASVLVGDVADEINADVVLVSSMAVHSKLLDANQLAEFVGCPLLLLP